MGKVSELERVKGKGASNEMRDARCSDFTSRPSAQNLAPSA